MANVQTPSIPTGGRLKTGIYTGTGVGGRDIDIGVDLLSKSIVWLVIKGNNTEDAVHKTKECPTTTTMFMADSYDAFNLISAFTATGFQVASDVAVNADGVEYRYIVFWQD